MSMAVIGGILLNIGAFLTMKGWIYHSVIIYIIADICWIFLAYDNGDMLGMLLITIGTILGFIAFYKMYIGKMKKKL